ncbi:MAG TPA: hypothetical protein PKE47_14805, partial [Verrucomicrobiota bacterium]|nr:hypothetical protein [Verrucomicrobiota bacterium]
PAEDNAPAWEALQRAQAAAPRLSLREQAYIRALGTRYEAEPRDDRAPLDRAFANAMREFVRAYPDDLDAQVFFAEALMNTMPWDYWTKDRAPKPETEEVLAALRFVRERNPDHPGANHFYIHAVEAGPQPELGVDAADRLLRFAPGAGHLVHMPAHIYMRVGRYEDAVTANVLAVKADELYLRRLRAQGFYPGVYYPHNIHFLWYALAYDGRSREALKTAEKAAEYALDNWCGPSKALEAPRLRHLPWITAARFGRWDEVLRVPQPAVTNDFLVDRAMWHFARGLAFAARGDAAKAGAEHALLAELAASDAARALDIPAFPASATLAVADHWLAGRVAAARGDWPAAIRLLEQAVEAEAALPYMEPAYWPFPARPALGAVLLAAGEPARAEAVFRADLAQWPRNAWGLFGLEQSLRAQGRGDAAVLVGREFQAAWLRADTRLDLAWF